MPRAYIHESNAGYINRLEVAKISKKELAQKIGICQTSLWHWLHYPLDNVRQWRVETALTELERRGN